MRHRPSASTLQHVTVPILNIYLTLTWLGFATICYAYQYRESYEFFAIDSPWSCVKTSILDSFSLAANSEYIWQCSPAPWHIKTAALTKLSNRRNIPILNYNTANCSKIQSNIWMIRNANNRNFESVIITVYNANLSLSLILILTQTIKLIIS